MKYVIGIDKSKKLHFEIEGREAHVLTVNFEAFVDDVINGKIDRKVLREMPQRLDTVEDWINHEFGEIKKHWKGILIEYRILKHYFIEIN